MPQLGVATWHRFCCSTISASRKPQVIVSVFPVFRTSFFHHMRNPTITIVQKQPRSSFPHSSALFPKLFSILHLKPSQTYLLSISFIFRSLAFSTPTIETDTFTKPPRFTFKFSPFFLQSSVSYLMGKSVYMNSNSVDINSTTVSTYKWTVPLYMWTVPNRDRSWLGLRH